MRAFSRKIFLRVTISYYQLCGQSITPSFAIKKTAHDRRIWGENGLFFYIRMAGSRTAPASWVSNLTYCFRSQIWPETWSNKKRKLRVGLAANKSIFCNWSLLPTKPDNIINLGLRKATTPRISAQTHELCLYYSNGSRLHWRSWKVLE